MRLVSIVLLYGVLMVSSCADQPENKAGTGSPATTSAQPPASKLGEAGTAHLLSMVKSYYELKDALVATKAGEADNAAGKLSVNADSVLLYVYTDSTKGKERTDQLMVIKSEIGKMTGMMDEGCEKKRVHFDVISTHLYELLKEAELKNGGIYRQYCPMAFNDKGAYWLSGDKEIKNPYFGSKMLECGEITDTIN